MKMIINGRYNWSHDKQTLLIFIGKKGSWNQFVKVDAPDDVWCEVLDEDLHMLEESAMNNQTVPDDESEAELEAYGKYANSLGVSTTDAYRLKAWLELRQREAVAQHEVGEAVAYWDETESSIVTKEHYEHLRKFYPKHPVGHLKPIYLPQDARELLEKAAHIIEQSRWLTVDQAKEIADEVRALVPTEKEPS